MTELKVGKTRLTLVQGDITVQQVDAIVNAANAALRGGGGVDGAIHRAGGPDIMAECRRDRRLPHRPGSPHHRRPPPCRPRHSYRRPVLVRRKRRRADLLASAYRRSLELAAAHGARTVAFPSISTGVYGYPKDMAAETALDAVTTAVANLDIDEVRFVVFGDDDLEIYRQAMQPRASQ